LASWIIGARRTPGRTFAPRTNRRRFAGRFEPHVSCAKQLQVPFETFKQAQVNLSPFRSDSSGRATYSSKIMA
jgi:hypothetical protein